MIRYLFVCLVLCFFVGCSATPATVYTVYVDDKFDQEDQDIIKAGLDEWSEYTQDAVMFNIVSLSKAPANETPEHTVYIIFSTSDVVANIKPYNTSALGATMRTDRDDNAFMYLDMTKIYSYFYNRFRQIIEHEMGHAMGMHFHLQNGNIMASSVNDVSDHLTCKDIKSFYETRGWDNFCIIPQPQ